MKQGTSVKDGQVASVVGSTQADLVRASLVGTKALSGSHRYGLPAQAMQHIRTRVHDATVEVLSHEGNTVEDVAHALELEVERAVWAIGVERLD